MEIIPAILAKTETELQEKLAAIPRTAEWVHIDLVENPPPYSPSSPRPPLCLPLIKGEMPRGNRGERGWSRGGGGGRIFEAHLMLPDPRALIDNLVRAGFSRIVVQVGKINPPPYPPSFIKEGAGGGFLTPEAFAELLHEWRGSVEIAPALEIETPLGIIDSFAHELKSVQLMGIAEIGAQGRPFDTRVVERVRALHTKYPHLTISVDGGVNKKNSEWLISAGARRLVVGSALKEFYG